MLRIRLGRPCCGKRSFLGDLCCKYEIFSSWQWQMNEEEPHWEHLKTPPQTGSLLCESRSVFEGFIRSAASPAGNCRAKELIFMYTDVDNYSLLTIIVWVIVSRRRTAPGFHCCTSFTPFLQVLPLNPHKQNDIIASLLSLRTGWWFFDMFHYTTSLRERWKRRKNKS